MPEDKELIKYIGEHCNPIPGVGTLEMHFYSDIECCLPLNCVQHEQKLKDLQVYEDDIWVLSYPKCASAPWKVYMLSGSLPDEHKYSIILYRAVTCSQHKYSTLCTEQWACTTWCQEMVWLIAKDLDYKGADVDLETRYSFLETDIFMRLPPIMHADDKDAPSNPDFFKQADNTDFFKKVENMSRPRFFKCHLPLALLPTQLFEGKAKVFFVLREPRDTAVSYLHHHHIIMGYKGPDEKFYEAFLKGCLLYGCYWHYLAPLWKLRHEPNVLVLTYEEMKKDLPQVIQRTADFIGKTIKQEDMPGLLEHLSFNKMKTNSATNYKGFVKMMNEMAGCEPPIGEFMRKGQVGDYKNAMSEELMKKFQQHHMEMKRKLGLADDKDFPY